MIDFFSAGDSLIVPLLGTWVHDLDPVIFWRIRWYGLAYVTAFIIGWWWVRHLAKTSRTAVPAGQVSDFILTVALGVIVGGRLGYVLLYQPVLLWSFSTDLPFWGALALDQGGMASHGGMVGALLTNWLFARRQRLPYLHLTDLTCFIAPLGFMMSRIANFINGELIGRITSPNLPWAVKFPQEIYEWPTEKWIELQEKLPPPEQVNYYWQAWTKNNLIAAVQRGEESVIEVLRPMLAPRHPSQLYASLLEGLVVFLILLIAWRKPRKPGVITALFGISYAVGRILNEFFRRPDPHIADAEFAWLNVTRGQWLSGLLLLAALMIGWYVRKKKSVPLPA